MKEEAWCQPQTKKKQLVQRSQAGSFWFIVPPTRLCDLLAFRPFGLLALADCLICQVCSALCTIPRASPPNVGSNGLPCPVASAQDINSPGGILPHQRDTCGPRSGYKHAGTESSRTILVWHHVDMRLLQSHLARHRHGQYSH